MIAAARVGEMFLLGLRNLFGYPLRTFLTMLGIIFGVAAVIAMLAVGEGAQAEILAQIGQLGIKNVIVNAVKPPEGKSAEASRSWINSYGLTFEDHRQIEDTIPGVDQVLPVHSLKDLAWRGGRKVAVTVYGVTAEHLDVLKLRVARGRKILPIDGRNLKRVCVIRGSLVRELGYFADPLDLRLRVGDDYFQVVGVLEDQEFASHTQKALAIDRKTSEIYAPYETILARRGTLSVTRRTGSFEATDVELNQIVVEARTEESVLPVARMIQRILERNHEMRDYEIVVPLELLAQRQQTQQTFNLVLLLIASISLLVGGIGIANIMLATITERTREIGIRRALGAKQRAILMQFLTETVTISAAGGLIGVALGVGLVLVVAPMFGWQAIVTPLTVFLALGISCAVGVMSGLFPAVRAARLDPIASLRYE